MEKLMQMMQRCMAVLSPTQGFSTQTYSHRAGIEQSDSALLPSVEIYGCSALSHPDDNGVYEVEDSTLCVFVNESPHVPTTPRARSQVDLVLPPAAAFTKPGQVNLLWPPVLGQKSVHWDQVFAPVKQPELLWDCWKPLKSLDQFNLEELWACYSLGEPVFNADGVQTGIKPPLQLVEKYFQSKWRGRSDHKQWEHFHELPEWILSEAATRVTSPLVIIEELANICNTATGNKMGLNVLSNHVKKLHFANAHS